LLHTLTSLCNIHSSSNFHSFSVDHGLLANENLVKITVVFQKPPPLLQKHKSPSTILHNRRRGQNRLKRRSENCALNPSRPSQPQTPVTPTPALNSSAGNVNPTKNSVFSSNPQSSLTNSSNPSSLESIPNVPSLPSLLVHAESKFQLNTSTTHSFPAVSSHNSTGVPVAMIINAGAGHKRARSPSPQSPTEPPLPSTLPAYKLHQPQNATPQNTNPTTIPIIFNPILQSDAQRNFFVFTSPTDHRYHSSFDVFPPHLWNVPGVVDFGVEEYVTTWPPSIQSELRQFLGAAASLVKTRIKLPPYST
jgi:hypothetical protein